LGGGGDNGGGKDQRYSEKESVNFSETCNALGEWVREPGGMCVPSSILLREAINLRKIWGKKGVGGD